MAKRPQPQPTAVDRLRDRINARIDADRHRPRDYRYSQRALADFIGVSKSTLNEMLNGGKARQGALARLDKIADYFGIPPSLLIHRNDTAMMEVAPQEYRLLSHWRRMPASVKERVLEMFDYFAGLDPEEQEARQLWHRFQAIRNSQVRRDIEQTIEDALRAQRAGLIEDETPAGPETFDATASAIRTRNERRVHGSAIGTGRRRP